MKKRSIMIAVLVILGIGLYPQRAVYEDGGTRTYSALLYKYIKRNVLVDCDDCVKPYYNEDQLILFPNNFKSLDEYWDDDNINKIPKYQENQKEITITKGTTNKAEPVVVGKLTVDKDAKYSISHSGKGDIIEYFVQYDAGNYDEDTSLSFFNQNAEEVRKKVNKKQNPFYKDWKHAKRYDGEKTKKYMFTAQHEKDGVYYIIKENGKEIYKSTKTFFTVEDAFKNFVVHGNDWRLLYNENKRNQGILKNKDTTQTRLIHNGEEVDIANAFALYNLDGKIFYFFQKNKGSKIQFYLDGKIYDTDFDEIIHDRCCEPGAYNLQISLDGKLAFRGVIGKKFTYNEMVLPGFSINLEALKDVREEEKRTRTTEQSDPKEVLENEIMKDLKELGFKFSEIEKGSANLMRKEYATIENSYNISAKNIDLDKLQRNDNLFIQNNRKEIQNFSWDASGVPSWQRIYQKGDVYCLIRVQSINNKNGGLEINCWDRKDIKDRVAFETFANRNFEKEKKLKVKIEKLLEKEILSNPLFKYKKPITTIEPFKKINLEPGKDLVKETQNRYYTLKLKDMQKEQFNPNTNYFLKNNWKEIKEYRAEYSGKFNRKMIYQKENNMCLVSVQIDEKTDKSKCSDPRLDCFPDFNVEISCWDETENFKQSTEEASATPRTAKERLEKEILTNPLLKDQNPVIKTTQSKEVDLGNDKKITFKNPNTQVYSVKFKDLRREEFTQEKNDFVQNNWKEMKAYGYGLSNRFGRTKVYQKDGSICLVKMFERADGSQCYDPEADCLPEADLEIVCWDGESKANNTTYQFDNMNIGDTIGGLIMTEKTKKENMSSFILSGSTKIKGILSYEIDEAYSGEPYFYFSPHKKIVVNQILPTGETFDVPLFETEIANPEKITKKIKEQLIGGEKVEVELEILSYSYEGVFYSEYIAKINIGEMKYL